MLEKQPRYITTTLPYVNADPHVGFALEAVQADTLARHWRLLGHEVFFNTGTDEHGQKIAQRADAEGVGRQAYVDHYAGEFEKLKDALNLSYDHFIRTTDESHKAAAQEIWRRCAEKGDIYKKSYQGLYCVGCELFYKENELDESRCCLIHKKPVEEVEEENYFFALSRYQDRLLDYLLQEPFVITPSWQQQWAVEFVKGGLEDFSISRRKERMDWGIEVPDDPEHVMYVWFDALTNYISTLGWPADADGTFKKFWQQGFTLQLAGKDQVRFQSIMWQAMLMSAEVRTSSHVFYHGFITSGGQKMSKSIGNVISPYDMVKRYGTDATRYILLRHIHPTDDSDVTWEKMDEWYTANLVNGLGNLTARIMKMAETHLEAPIERPASGEFDVEYTDALDRYDFQAAADIVWRKVGELDERITTTEPFKLVKTDPERAKTIIAELARDLYLIARLLYPIMPETNAIIKEAVLQNKKPDNLFNRLD